MRLLFDQNLSHRLLPALEDLFPSSLHVRFLGLAEADDLAIWNYAKDHQLIIVTQDSDYSDWNKLRGAPPKIIWLRCGNASAEKWIRRAAGPYPFQPIVPTPHTFATFAPWRFKPLPIRTAPARAGRPRPAHFTCPPKKLQLL